MNFVSKHNLFSSWTLMLTLSLCVLLGMFSNAAAEDYYWLGGTGSWEDPSNWNPYKVPSGGWFSDHIYLTNAPDINATAYFSGAPYLNNFADIGSLQIYGSGGGTMTLSVSDPGYLSPSYFSIGDKGILDQTGGIVRALGHSSVLSGGTYNMSGGGLSTL